MIACENKQLKELLNTNESFKMNFEKLLLAFQERLWTKDVCSLFKALCEDLFNSYHISVRVHVNDGISGGGRFEIEFLDRPSKKSVDRNIFDVVKWLLRK